MPISSRPVMLTTITWNFWPGSLDPVLNPIENLSIPKPPEDLIHCVILSHPPSNRPKKDPQGEGRTDAPLKESPELPPSSPESSDALGIERPLICIVDDLSVHERVRGVMTSAHSSLNVFKRNEQCSESSTKSSRRCADYPILPTKRSSRLTE